MRVVWVERRVESLEAPATSSELHLIELNRCEAPAASFEIWASRDRTEAAASFGLPDEGGRRGLGDFARGELVWRRSW